MCPALSVLPKILANGRRIYLPHLYVVTLRECDSNCASPTSIVRQLRRVSCGDVCLLQGKGVSDRALHLGMTVMGCCAVIPRFVHSGDVIEMSSCNCVTFFVCTAACSVRIDCSCSRYVISAECHMLNVYAYFCSLAHPLPGKLFTTFCSNAEFHCAL